MILRIKGKQVENLGINMELDNSFYREINNTGQIGMTSKLIVDSMKYRLVQFGKEYLNEIVIEKAPFVIGKKPELCDGIIDNSAVSRVHAKLLLEDGGVYLMDMNSRNGTYVNGYRITGGEKVRLNQNDEVRFANDLFYFR